MTTCSDTDSFRLVSDMDYIYNDYGVVSSPNGCYEESSYDPTASDEAADHFYSDGGLSDYEYFFRTHELNDGVEVWIIATYLDDAFDGRCYDYLENDYTTLHPTEVVYWTCEDDDGDFSLYYNSISITCGCDTPAPTATPATPAPTAVPATPAPTAAPATPAPTAAPATPSRTATPGPTPAPLAPETIAVDGLTPAPRTLTATSSPTHAPEVASSPPPVNTASDEAAPAGTITGGVVAGMVVVGVVILAALFKTGRLKKKRAGKQLNSSHDDVVSGSTISNARPAVSEAPVPHQYPVAYQYPEAL
ncbi:unnamed protein product [Ectocarpus fasciculatus]